MTSNNGTAQISRTNGDIVDPTQEIIKMEQDLAELTDFVTSNPGLLGGEDVAELLARLANAETMAEGMESKIDGILQNLDSLLGTLKDPSADTSSGNDPAQDVVGSPADGDLTKKDEAD